MMSWKAFQKGTLVIATIDIVTSVLSFISIFFMISLTIAYGEKVKDLLEKGRDTYPEVDALFELGMEPFIMTMILCMVPYILYFFLGRYLLYAAEENSYKKVRRWCTITMGIIIARLCFFIVVTIIISNKIAISSYGALGFLYQIFCFWFVRAYAEKLSQASQEVEKFQQQLPYSNDFMGGGTMTPNHVIFASREAPYRDNYELKVSQEAKLNGNIIPAGVHSNFVTVDETRSYGDQKQDSKA